MSTPSHLQESARSIYVCSVCGWWEGDKDGEGEGHCNGWPEASHALTVMERVEVVPLSVAEKLATDAEWLASLVYEFILVGPRRRTGLSQVEVDRFLGARQALADHRAAYPREETTG